MPEYIRTSQTFVKPIDVSSKTMIVSINRGTRNSVTHIKKVETSMTTTSYAYSPPVTVMSNSGLLFDLSFAFSIQKANFLLNNKEIGFFNTEKHKATTFSINHNYLAQGDNTFTIRTIDLSDKIEDKSFNVNYEAGMADDLAIGSQIIINSKQYKVLECIFIDGEYEVTLDKPLEKDVSAARMLESSKIHYSPLVDVTFEDDSPSFKPMQFVKALFKDGLVEEEYELSGLVGDQLHTKILLNRDTTDEEPVLKKIERFTIART